MPSLVLATRLVRLCTVMFSRSLGVKNLRPKVLYFLHASAGHWHTVHTPASFSSPHSRQFCRCVSPSLDTLVLRAEWPVIILPQLLSASINSLPRVLYSTWQRFTHQHRGLAANFTKSSNCSGTPVSNDSWWHLYQQHRENRRFNQR